MFKKRYYAVLVQDQQGIFSFLKKQKIKASTAEITYKDKTYPIDMNTPTYSKGLYFFYFIDTEQGQLTFYEDVNSNINPEVIDLILRKNIIAQLTSNLTGEGYKALIFPMILGAIIGFLAGMLFGGGFFV